MNHGIDANRHHIEFFSFTALAMSTFLASDSHEYCICLERDRVASKGLVTNSIGRVLLIDKIIREMSLFVSE